MTDMGQENENTAAALSVAVHPFSGLVWYAVATSPASVAPQNTADRPSQLLMAPPPRPPSTPGNAIANHGVQRLPPAQAPRKVGKENEGHAGRGWVAT